MKIQFNKIGSIRFDERITSPLSKRIVQYHDREVAKIPGEVIDAAMNTCYLDHAIIGSSYPCPPNPRIPYAFYTRNSEGVVLDSRKLPYGQGRVSLDSMGVKQQFEGKEIPNTTIIGADDKAISELGDFLQPKLDDSSFPATKNVVLVGIVGSDQIDDENLVGMPSLYQLTDEKFVRHTLPDELQGRLLVASRRITYPIQCMELNGRLEQDIACHIDKEGLKYFLKA